MYMIGGKHTRFVLFLLFFPLLVFDVILEQVEQKQSGNEKISCYNL